MTRIIQFEDIPPIWMNKHIKPNSPLSIIFKKYNGRRKWNNYNIDEKLILKKYFTSLNNILAPLEFEEYSKSFIHNLFTGEHYESMDNSYINDFRFSNEAQFPIVKELNNEAIKLMAVRIFPHFRLLMKKIEGYGNEPDNWYKAYNLYWLIENITYKAMDNYQIDGVPPDYYFYQLYNNFHGERLFELYLYWNESTIDSSRILTMKIIEEVLCELDSPVVWICELNV